MARKIFLWIGLGLAFACVCVILIYTTLIIQGLFEPIKKAQLESIKLGWHYCNFVIGGI